MKVIFTFLVCTFFDGFACYIYQVHTSQGIVQGNFYENDVGESYNFFLGIPYAQAPTGNKRFMSPESPKYFEYHDGSTYDPNMCVQSKTITSAPEGNEDCLYLSIYTPSVPTSERHAKLNYPKYPVMVWFHDGRFDKGSGNYGGVRPDYLVNKGVVVVTVNYRLGVFGFLSFGNKELPGNMGLKDQVQSLKWVNEEIEKFGGDKKKITVFGSGSGAASIHYLILCESCRKLFQRAILQSGSAHNPWTIQRQPLEKTKKLLTKFGINTFKEANLNIYVNLLQESTASQYSSDNVLKSSIDITDQKDKITIFSPFLPVIENDKSPDAIIKKPIEESTKELKKSNNLQVIIGFNKDEGINFVNENIRVIQYTNEMLELFLPKDDTNKEKCLQLLNNEYFNNSVTEDVRHEFVNMVGDSQYIYGIYKTAKEFANAGITTYFYRFSYDDNEYKSSSYKNLHGVPHGAEYKYLFRPKDGFFGNEANRLKNENERNVQKNILNMWKSFADNGNPTPDKNPVDWKPLDKNDISYLDIGETLRMIKFQETSRMNTWNEIMTSCKK